MTSDDTPWLSADEQRIWRHWLAAHAQLNAALQRQLQSESDLSMPDFVVLVHLSEAREDRLRIAELAADILWERSRLSHHLTRMEKRGLVRREDCPSDRRGAFIALTPEGRAAIEDAAPGHVREVRRLFLDGVSDDDLAAMDRVSTHLLDQLGGTEAGA